MLNRLKTAAKGDGNTPDSTGKWSRRGSGTGEGDQFRVQQQGYFVRGDLVVDVHQARGIRPGTAGDRSTYCVVLVDGERVGETSVCPRTQAPVWNQPIKVAHETIRRAADRNLWPVPYQPLTVQVWDRSNSSDTLLGSARVMMSSCLKPESSDGWHRLIGNGDQGGAGAGGGGSDAHGGNGDSLRKIRIMTHWDSKKFSSGSQKDESRFYLRDVFDPAETDYRHLYYGGLSSTILAPPAGAEVLLEMMAGISRHDPSAAGYGKGVEGMLVLTELRLLFLPDISGGTTTASFLDFHTVQVYLAAVRSFSHRGLEGGSRLLSVVARDGRSVHFRMPAAVSAARCGTWFEAEAARRRRAQGAGRGVAAVVGSVAGLGGTVGSGAEEIWLRGLWGAGSSEQWMERLVDEIRWRKAQGDFVSLWYKLVETTAIPASAGAAAANTLLPVHKTTSPATSTPRAGAGGYGVAGASAGTPGSGGGTTNIAKVRGDAADGWAALERDLERVGVQGGGVLSSFSSFGRQMWEFKTVNKGYKLVPTYPETLAFPSSITPAQLVAAAPQRSRYRMPALVWLHPVSKAPLVRSSQPMAGMTTKVLSEDIYLLKQIRVTLDATKISIVDARSLLNAKANQVTGKGYEDVADIGRDVATLGFMGIDNIHAVRDSLASFSAASQAQGTEYFLAVGASGWLRHLAQIMKGAAFVVDELQKGIAVLVHCSDGWDRTAQLTALAQLYMDPYYRSMEGFEVLVEKEWCSFGHMFGLRAHSDSPTESSPVFLQWLDAVWQLVRQYPASFEFTGHYLERLVEALYSAAFLTFTGNSERERRAKLKDLQESGSGGVSVFTYLREHAMEGHMTSPLLNPLYRPPTSESITRGCGVVGKGPGAPTFRAVDVLRPCCEAQGLEIWQAVYMRDNLLLHHREHQLSVEQGLRLQVYDCRRRIALIEEHMERMPRGLASQLAASAASMSGPQWDNHHRLVSQAASDQDARAARVAAMHVATRGRSQQRAGVHGRSALRDDGSRSRSRSFNLPLRGWVSGAERRQRWASQDSTRDTDAGEMETARRSEAHSGSGSGSVSASGSAVSGNDEEVDGERSRRNRSFFSFGKKHGISDSGVRGRMNSAASGLDKPVAMSESSDESSGSDSKKKSFSVFGGRGRRRTLSTADIGSGDRGGGNVSRSRMFSSSSRETIAPSMDPSPPGASTASADAAAAVVATTSAAAARAARRRRGLSLARSNSLDDAALNSSGLVDGLAANKNKRYGGRSRMTSTAEASVTTGDKQQVRSRHRALSTATTDLELVAESPSRSPEADSGGSGGDGGSSNRKGHWWQLPKRRKSGTGAGSGGPVAALAGGANAIAEKKGLWGSLQRTVGGSSKSSSNQTAATQAAALGTNDGGHDQKAAPEASTSRTLSAAEIKVRQREEEEAEARREMLHTIITMEVQLLVRDVVDAACLQAAERQELLKLEVKTPPSASSDPVAHALVSVSTSTSERPAFFDALWTGGERQTRRHSNVEDNRGLGATKASAAREQEVASAESSRQSRGGDSKDDGFFAILRRKLFEGQDDVREVDVAKAINAECPPAARGSGNRGISHEASGGATGAGGRSGGGATARPMTLRPGIKGSVSGSSTGAAGTGVDGSGDGVAGAAGSSTAQMSRGHSMPVTASTTAVTATIRPRQTSGATGDRMRHNSGAMRKQPSPSAAPATPPLMAMAGFHMPPDRHERAAAAASGGGVPTSRRAVYAADAGAGADRWVDRPRGMSGDRSAGRSLLPERNGGDGGAVRPKTAPEVAEEAAAKFGLVRMVFGE